MKNDPRNTWSAHQTPLRGATAQASSDADGDVRALEGQSGPKRRTVAPDS